MTPQQFIAKWQKANLSERAACQEHFLDLCALLGQDTPATADPDGAFYTFERGCRKTAGGQGWADVWMRGHFGWEYKGKHRSLVAAYQQLLLYREDLENPPLLVVCDLDRFEVHTNFTRTAKRVYAFDLAGLARPENLDILRKVFTEPDALRPGVTTETITRQAAERFGVLADGLRVRGIEAQTAAHFLMKLMFCMFGEDIKLLPEKLFTRLLAGSKNDPRRLAQRMSALFEAMAHGGDFGTEEILWFNGGLFSDAQVIELTPEEIDELLRINGHDWANVEPSIFGTLFERTLDPSKRSQIGAHYTSRDHIETLLEPVVMAPLRREWAGVRARCDALWEKVKGASKDPAARSGAGARVKRPAKAVREFEKPLLDFVQRLAHVRVFDPACGSGNFLYVAIHLLLDLEKEVIAYGAARGVGLLPQVRPTQLCGIEINPFAQQLAQVVIWIGYLQWMHHNGFNPPSHPVLEPIESIELKDAILDLSDPQDPKEPEWPEAEFIVGNPPFLGNKQMRSQLGPEYVEPLWRLYGERLPATSDLCCYWLEKGRDMVASGKTARVGLLATTAITQANSRHVLERVGESCRILWAISDRDWVLDGAAVRISMIGFGARDQGGTVVLDGTHVQKINADLTGGCDLTGKRRLARNHRLCFMGVTKVGDFDIPFDGAIEMLRSVNPNGRPSSDVLRPFRNGSDIVRVCSDRWIIDFGATGGMEWASQYERPFQHLVEHVREERQHNGRDAYRERWWIHGEARPGFRTAIAPMKRYLATARVAKHRIFVWLDSTVLPDSKVIAIAFEDDARLGVLQSRVHEIWTLATCGWHGKGNDATYNPQECFETFPFPDATSGQEVAIAEAARELDRLRTAWLNPPEWTRTEVLEFPGSTDGPWARYVQAPDVHGIGIVRFPRIVPRDDECAAQLKKRTLTNLYNQRPTWLDLAHRKLDESVFAAYGWDPGTSDEALLEKLLALNLARAGAEDPT